MELTIVDETVVTDAGLSSLLMAESNHLNSIDEGEYQFIYFYLGDIKGLNLVDLTQSERNDQTLADEQMKLVLNVDVQKVDQVIRNLISNAVFHVNLSIIFAIK